MCTNPSGKTSSGPPAPVDNVDMDAAAAPAPSHALVPRLLWMISPLLKLLRCMQTPSVASSLRMQMQGALAMADAEQASLLGELTTARGAAGCSSMIDAKADFEDIKVREIRTWSKGVRDAGYDILGLSASRIGEGLLVDVDGQPETPATALREDVEHIELHLVIIPVVKACPVPLRDPWLRQLSIFNSI